ncbi:MAG: hypothetical protein CMJ77_20340 [Planctomycetaceae bacterium]|nr:hypothetical protein [Planctomycetaceae bacterium]
MPGWLEEVTPVARQLGKNCRQNRFTRCHASLSGWNDGLSVFLFDTLAELLRNDRVPLVRITATLFKLFLKIEFVTKLNITVKLERRGMRRRIKKSKHDV